MVGGIAALVVGHSYTGTIRGAFKAWFIALVLSILEISLSFDNAVVNALILKKMTHKWQHRFLTWGILIAVFGMRLVFPLILVGVLGHINPIEALKLALFSPADYAHIMMKSRISIAAFGGAFLFLVAMKYFFEHRKEVYWIHSIERPLSAMGRLNAAEIAVTLFTLYLFSRFQMPSEQMNFLAAGIGGVITFILVDGLSEFLNSSGQGKHIDLNRTSMSLFLYLEVLDASFSFDGVVGAFAITNNLFIIMIGLGVGAFFVRSITIMLVEKNTLHQYRYLEHGAFYAIGILAMIMFVGTIKEIPEVFTGLIGIIVIGAAIISSIRYNARNS
ncbi:DUF475 domain-containing protein [Peredibacter starrii]|uniref:DUF475 domain-containing protein n=1 Tax=Peredibacter starrii TaxID=28202 RepID=A0AAX4HU14_9BACT|nr:DUF475 domain-containing protein [Peredibacter starrii]WPU66859.1 DUF475 domain-containing protein [Peredibacter starrii]